MAVDGHIEAWEISELVVESIGVISHRELVGLASLQKGQAEIR
jgi:hypothetical protein